MLSSPCLRKTYSFWDHPQLHTSGPKSNERRPDFWTGSKLGWFYSRLHFMFICYPLFFLFFGTIRPPTPAMNLSARTRRTIERSSDRAIPRFPDGKLLDWIYTRLCFFGFFCCLHVLLLYFGETFLKDVFTGRFLQDAITRRF